MTNIENMILEACVETLQEARMAQELGADRIELCADLSVGGITPSYSIISSAYKILRIPIMVMIRPRGGNFRYNQLELKIMEQSIEICKTIGVYGVVFGLLTKNKEIDIENTSRLVKKAASLQITFHKAIDETADILKATEDITNITGITRILTSGGKETALEGAEVINQMVSVCKEKVKILAAGKITHTNLSEIRAKTNTNEFHGKKIVGDLFQTQTN